MAHTKPPASQRGAAIIELALVLPILLLLAAGIVEFGRTLWYYDALSKASRNAARYLSTVDIENLGSEAGNSGNTKAMVVNAAGAALIHGFSSSHVTVSCINPNDASVTCASAAAAKLAGKVTYVRVAISYPMSFGEWLPILQPPAPLSVGDSPQGSALNLSPQTTMRYMF